MGSRIAKPSRCLPSNSHKFLRRLHLLTSPLLNTDRRKSPVLPNFLTSLLIIYNAWNTLRDVTSDLFFKSRLYCMINKRFQVANGTENLRRDISNKAQLLPSEITNLRATQIGKSSLNCCKVYQIKLHLTARYFLKIRQTFNTCFIIPKIAFGTFLFSMAQLVERKTCLMSTWVRILDTRMSPRAQWKLIWS